jgi:hypothetical protein
VVVLCLGCRCLPSVNTICGRVMIGLSLSSSANTICGRFMIGLSLSSVSKHNMLLCLLMDDNNDIPMII